MVPWLQGKVNDYDCVIVHGLWQYHGYAVMKTAQRKGVPYFVYPHGMLDPWFKRCNPLKHLKKAIYWQVAESKVMSHALGVIFTCEEEKRLAATTFRPYRCSPLVAPLGIHAPAGEAGAQVEAFYNSFPGIDGKPFLLYLGRVHPKKGLDLLLDAALALGKPLPNLVIAGPVDDSAYQQRLIGGVEKIKEQQPGWQCLWGGMLEGDLKWGAFRAASAFVLPSHQENFGIAVVEALSVGTPVLITEKVNIFREIIDANAGLACADTVGGLRGMLSTWFAMDTEEKEVFSRNAVNCFYENYEITQAARHLVDVLGDAIGRGE